MRGEGEHAKVYGAESSAATVLNISKKLQKTGLASEDAAKDAEDNNIQETPTSIYKLVEKNLLTDQGERNHSGFKLNHRLNYFMNTAET